MVSAADGIMQAKGQIGFIDLFTKPLFRVTASVIPGMFSFIVLVEILLT